MKRLATILFLASLSLADGATRFVWLGGSHTSPYTNWTMAATNLDAAMTGYSAGDSILLTNGYWPAPTGRTVVANLAIESVNGSAVTTIDGGGNLRKVDAGGFLAWGTAGSSNALRGVTVTRFNTQGGLNSSYASQYIEVVDCVFTGNVDNGTNPGNLFGFDASIGIFNMDRCIIRCNAISGNYGGLIGANLALLPGAWTISNTLIADNTSAVSAGISACGVYVFGPTNFLLRNCSIANNASSAAGEFGGVRVYTSGKIQLENTILWGNTGPAGSNYSTNVEAIYTDTGPALSGEGNISAAPSFTSATDYSLQSGSPCIDVGTNRAWMVGVDDLAGNDRIVNTIVDLGAYEYSAAASGDPSMNREAALQWWRMIQ